MGLRHAAAGDREEMRFMAATQEPGPAVGLSELDVLALTLHHEAAGEGARGMVAVGCVIRNRAAWGRWGATIREVCLAPKQFSCWMKSGGVENFGALVLHADALRHTKRPRSMTKAFEVAANILGDVPDVTLGADHYYAPAAMDPPGRVPSWARGKTPTTTIGRHLFFRLRPDGEVARA